MIEVIIAVVSLVISSLNVFEAKRTRDEQKRFFDNQKEAHEKILECMNSMESLLQFKEELIAQGNNAGAEKVQELLNVLAGYETEESFVMLNTYLRSKDFCQEIKKRYSDIICSRENE